LGSGGCRNRGGGINLGFMGFRNLIVVITWPSCKTLIEIIDMVGACMCNFKRRMNYCIFFLIIIRMQQVKKNLFGIFKEKAEATYNKQLNALEKFQF
jgi:hypothetical protein